MTEATGIQRDWRWEVNMGTIAVPVWTIVTGLQDFTPSVQNTDQEDNDYESNGWKGYTRTAFEWGIEANVSQRFEKLTKVENTVQALLRTRGENTAASTDPVHMRWYDKSGGPEAYEGFGLVTWGRSGGGMDELRRADITVVPSAESPELEVIDNPLNENPLPLIASLTPATGGTAGGNHVLISGAYFTSVTGATGVKFGATNATTYTVVSDSAIVATAPAGSAGTVRVTVTNTNGASADTAADDYTYA